MPAWHAYVLGLLGGGVLLALLLMVFAAFTRPDTSLQPKAYSSEELATAEKARDVSFDPDTPQILHVDVPDEAYAQVQSHLAALSAGKASAEKTVSMIAAGDLPAWFPHNEAPVLAELVAEGHLPPVHERVGPEPIVMRGVDGIGVYGGTWLRIGTSPNDVGVITYRLSGANLVRYSPLGYPIKLHLARRIEKQDEGRVWLVTLRRGIRWSDGHSLDADNIMYWWEHEVLDKAVGGKIPNWMMPGGKPGRVEKVDQYTVRFTFGVPDGLFMDHLAMYSNGMMQPAHYLRNYHPTLGDPAFLKQRLAAHGLKSPRSLYHRIRDFRNPDCPRLWPWVYRKHKNVPPQVFVRNPYYFVVDEQGDQLPYIDRVQFEVQDNKMLSLSAANGLVSMQTRHMRFENYTELMSRREQSGTRILHWYPACRSVYAINPNLNRRVSPDEPETKWKAALLLDKRFRQALSLAIDRAIIIEAEYHNLVEPAQVSPGPQSPFHSEKLHKAFTEFDPARANGLLDAVWADLNGNPAQRDSEGFRVYPDGTRMVFYLDYCAFTGVGPAQFVVDDWADVGVRVIPRERARTLFYREKAANNFDFNVWSSESDYLPLVCPRYFLSFNGESFYAGGWGRWYALGGYYGAEQATESKLSIPVPKDHPMYESLTAYEEALQAVELDDQVRLFQRALDNTAENLWSINISTAPPQLVVVKKGFRNVPENALYGVIFHTPANAGIESYFFEDPQDSPGAIRETRESILRAVPMPGEEGDGGSVASATGERPPTEPRSKVVGRLIRFAVLGIVVALILMVSVRHPFIARRLVIMGPTLLIISVCAFTIIQLPPGDFLTTRIMQLQEAGDNAEAEKQQLEELKQMFYFEDPTIQRYFRWMGVYWFRSFDRADKGLLQGNMGLSMETLKSVNDMVGDRVLLTFLISLGTILFTWAVAIPIGIYSAVRQHSISDYALTAIGFLGMCIPPFLLALILMTIANVSGLFSPDYATQPEWTWGKVLDLLKHIWIPIAVMGVGGTAGMIRVMRANLLDELRKPYVTTARAKGVRPMKLLFKYPVRMALNPFISGIGGLFPQLISGGTIVAMVLALPTVGPMMLAALFSQDMNLAGSLLMVLSLLGVFGTLVSDLLLLWLDPRIRLQGGTR